MAKQAYLYVVDETSGEELPVVIGVVRQLEDGTSTLILNGDDIAKLVDNDELGTVSLVSGERFHAAIQQ